MSNNNWESQLSILEKNTYLDLFKKVDADNKGIVLHDEAMEFLKKSGIPQNILNQFWSATDNENKGFLTEQEFCTILKLIACAQHSVVTSDPILATKVPLPEFNGTGMVNRQQTTGAEVITPEERQKYIGLFNSFGPENNILSGDRARAAFIQSNLPPQILQTIWNLADTRKSGSLNQTEFIIAMFYIERAMKGFNNFPPSLPASIYASATGRPTGSPLVRNTTLHVNSPPPIPMRSPVFKGRTVVPVIISPEEYQKYQGFFNRLDTDRTGYVSGQDAVVFFRHSKLPESDLARIWDLADTNSSGMLSEQEFAMAMYMINRKVNGGDIPNTLPTFNIQQQQQQQQPPPQPQPQQQQQNVDLLGLSFDAPPPLPPTTPSQSSIVDLNRSQSVLQSETNRVQNARQQLQKETLAVHELNNQIDKEKESLAKIKAEAEEAERLLEAEKKKKEELTEQLRMYRQETKHFMTRADNAKEEMKKVKSEIEELEKTSGSNKNDNQHNVFSLSSGPSLGTSGLFAKVNDSEIKPQHTGSSTRKEGAELFSKVNEDSHKSGPAKTFDPFAGFKASNSNTPSPTLSLNKLKESEQNRRPSTPTTNTSTNLDISDIESKFPDLNTMEQNFAPAAATTATTAAAPPSPSPPSPPKPAGSTTNIFSPKKTETTTSPAVSKYGFDLSAFESFGDNTTSTKDELSSLFTSPTQKKKENDDDFDNIFGNKNSATPTNTTTTTTTGTNFEDIFFK